MPHTKGTEKKKSNSDTNLESKSTTEKKKKTHNPFKILKDKIKGLTNKKDKGDKKKQEPIINQIQPATLSLSSSTTTQPIASSVTSPTSRTIMTERPLGTEKISPPLALATSLAPETSAVLSTTKTVTVSSQTEATVTSPLPNITVTPPPSVVTTTMPVSTPTSISATAVPKMPTAETVSLANTADAVTSSLAINTTNKQVECTNVEVKKSHGTTCESTWDFSAIPEDDTEELNQIAPLTQKDTTENEGSRATKINAALETYVPGWRLLMHSILGPIAQYNIEASDAWVEKLAGYLPSSSDSSNLLTPQSLGFLPSGISLMSGANTQKAVNFEETLSNNQRLKI